MPAPPPSGLDADARLRAELVALLRGGQAHAGLHALDGVPPDRAAERPDGAPHTLGELLWHLWFTQRDILAFCLDETTDGAPGYREAAWPDAYWPSEPVDWDATRERFLADLDRLVGLAETADLAAELPHAPGYTVLRELLLAADHNAHHLGQVIALRRHLGLWPPTDDA